MAWAVQCGSSSCRCFAGSGLRALLQPGSSSSPWSSGPESALSHSTKCTKQGPFCFYWVTEEQLILIKVLLLLDLLASLWACLEKPPCGCQDLSCGWGCTTGMQEASHGSLWEHLAAGAGICLCQCGSICDIPPWSPHSPGKPPWFQNCCTRDMMQRTHKFRKYVARFVGFFCKSGLRIFFGSCCHCSFGVEEDFLSGL